MSVIDLKKREVEVRPEIQMWTNFCKLIGRQMARKHGGVTSWALNGQGLWICGVWRGWDRILKVERLGGSSSHLLCRERMILL